MKEAESVIASMSKLGVSAKIIAGELYDRGLRNAFGRTYTAAMVEGFLRYTALDEEQLAAAAKIKPAPPPEPTPAPIVVTSQSAKISPYSKDADPVAEPLPKLRMLKPWPLHTDYHPENLNVRD